MRLNKKIGRFDFEISTEEIIPPLPTGGKFAAEVLQIREETSEGKKELFISFGENYGRTETEAIQELCEYIKEWVESQ
jgi:hypothetical protein